MNSFNVTQPKILTFLDTGVLLSAFRGEDALAQAAFAVIDDADREFVVSIFLKLELLPKASFNKNEDEIAFYNDYFNAASCMVDTTPELLESALSLACEFGMGAVDAIHFHVAMEAGAVEFVTTEKPTKPFFRVNRTNINVTSLNSAASL
ncbi:MAG: PIN domain-containing protein [Gallionella sp.]|nr:PIN domain-containing protein [Gallionella sp.]